MKKIVALLITFGSFATAFSQSQKIEEAKRVINGETREEKTVYGEPTRYPSSTSAEEAENIHREYDRKIDAVQRNPILSSSEKERRIRDLQNERDRKIGEINKRYEDGRKRKWENKNGYAKNKKYKKDNGKHLGWEKGVGNPHKSGNKKKDTHAKGKRKKK
jgi:hypothetical protein